MIGNTMVKMPDEDIEHLRVLILRACLDPNGKSKRQLLEGKDLGDYPQRFAPQTIMELVRGLQRSGLLYSRGVTRASLYFLTIQGQEALKRFQDELDRKKQE